MNEGQTTNQSGYGQQAGFSGYGYQGNPFDELERDMCQQCHRRKIDRSKDPKAVLCRECQEAADKQKKQKIMIGAGVGAFVVAAVAAVCVAVFTLMPKAKASKNDADEPIISADVEEIPEEAEEPAKNKVSTQRRLENLSPVEIELDEETQAFIELADTGMIATALDGMLDALEEDPDNVGMAVAVTDVAMKYTYPDYAAYAIDTYLTGKNVPDDVYDRVTGYIDKLNVYYDTYDLVDEIWNDFSEQIDALGESAAEDDYLMLLQDYHDMIEAYTGIEEYDQAFLYYDLAYTCQDEEERIQHLKDCVAIDPNYFDASAQLATYYRRQGDLEQARKILEESYAVNKESYSVLRSMATLELVEGNLEQGLTYAQNAYDIYSEGEYVIDTYIVALTANGQTEEAETLTKQWEDEGYVFDEDFYTFKAGGMTLEDYYIGD